MSSAQNDPFLAGADVQPRELDDVLRLRGCVLLRCVPFSACCCGSGCRSAGCCRGGGLSNTRNKRHALLLECHKPVVVVFVPGFAVEL